MTKKTSVVAAALLCIASIATAQPRMNVDRPVRKIGEIIYNQPKTVEYEITNKGNRPLVISQVHPSCGCVEVAYPVVPVPAGGKSKISATYDAKMLGTFYKELAVYTNISQEPVYLSFDGRVVTSLLQQDLSEDFPIDLGSVRLNVNSLEFDDVNKGDHPVAELLVYNTERGTYKPELMHLPPYLKAEYLPETIYGGKVGKIRVTLDSEKLYMDGLNQTDIYLARYPGDKVGADNSIVVSAVLLPSFRNLTTDKLKTAPYIVLSEDELNFGPMGDKPKLTATIDVTNIGEEPLLIHSVQVFNQAVNVSLKDRFVAPHKTTKLKVTVNAKYLKKAKNAPRVLIISNDPRHAKTVLPITVEP